MVARGFSVRHRHASSPIERRSSRHAYGAHRCARSSECSLASCFSRTSSDGRAAGYAYSSSIYPIHHDLYGMPEAPRFPFRYRGNGILEIPISTARIFRFNWPSGGGGYFRLIPYAVFRAAIRRNQPTRATTLRFLFSPVGGRCGATSSTERQSQKSFSSLSKFESYGESARASSRRFRWGRMDRVFLESERAS